MSELDLKILELIDKKYTINEIISTLNLSREQLYKEFNKMKQIGMNFNKKYYSCGEVVYTPKKELYVPSKVEYVDIITEPDVDNFRALLISDLHIGNKLECVDAWHKAYDYCINNGIHIIIIIGDFLDGIHIGKSEFKLHSHPNEQIEYALKSYPFDSNILNFLILGNHDIDSLTSFGIDFAERLRNERHDIVPVGYGRGLINIKNDKIILAHPLGIVVASEHDLSSNYLLIKGHSHTARTTINCNCSCSLLVPSLSNLFLTDNEFLPGAIDLTIKFKDGYFDIIYYEHLLFGNKIYAISSTQYSVSHAKDRKFNEKIKYEENLNKKKIKKRDKEPSL